MGVQLLTVTSRIKLLILCYVFINNISVSVMFTVPGNLDPGVREHNVDIEQVEDPDDGDVDQGLDFELESIKKTMVEGLGFKKVPDITKMNVSQDEYSRMYDVYLNRLEQRKLDELDDIIENVPRLFTFYQKERQIRRARRRSITKLVFNISSIDASASVQHSTLRLLAASSAQSGPVRVKVYQILDRQRTLLIEEKDIFLAAEAPKWCEFDVTTAMKNWIENDERNYGLELHCTDCKRLGHSFMVEDNQAPVLNALMTVDTNVREKRSAEQMLFYEKNRRTDCHNRNSKKCCRHKMDFDLTQLGLDFIIQPKKFDGGICKGRCPPHYNAAHNHAVLQSLMWKKNKNVTPRVCCAPSKLQYLEILVVDEDDPAKLTVKRWENMIVLECACS